MHRRYSDIIDKIGEPPQWFDEGAVPRYCGFSPDVCADIYTKEAVFVLITCQGCGHKFKVAITRLYLTGRTLAEDILSRDLHYGDPPNIGCCESGPSMNSEPRQVLEYWSRHDRKYVDDAGLVRGGDVDAYMAWKRRSEYEVDVTPDWVLHPP